MANTQLQQYREMKFHTASAPELLLLTYDQALKSLRRARKACAAGDPNKMRMELLVGIAAVVELQATLNREVQPLADKLDGLYNYVLDQIGRASDTMKLEPLNEAFRIMSSLNEAWRQASGPAE